jgi:hypothetical protein
MVASPVVLRDMARRRAVQTTAFKAGYRPGDHLIVAMMDGLGICRE